MVSEAVIPIPRNVSIAPPCPAYGLSRYSCTLSVVLGSVIWTVGTQCGLGLTDATGGFLGAGCTPWAVVLGSSRRTSRLAVPERASGCFIGLLPRCVCQTRARADHPSPRVGSVIKCRWGSAAAEPRGDCSLDSYCRRPSPRYSYLRYTALCTARQMMRFGSPASS